jgi:hypothetical protein
VEYLVNHRGLNLLWEERGEISGPSRDVLL